MKKYFILLVLVLIQSCSGGGGSGGDDTSGDDSINNTSPSLADIVGVWDDSETIDGLYDEYYFVIKTNGDFVVYDYLGDSYDNLRNCYLTYTDTISDLGGGNFLYTSGSNGESAMIHITISNGGLIETVDGVTEPVIVPSSLQESDFAPICDF